MTSKRRLQEDLELYKDQHERACEALKEVSKELKGLKEMKANEFIESVITAGNVMLKDERKDNIVNMIPVCGKINDMYMGFRIRDHSIEIIMKEGYTLKISM